MDKKCQSIIQFTAIEEARWGIFERPEFTIPLTYFFENLQGDFLRLFLTPPIQLPNEATFKISLCRYAQQTMQEVDEAPAFRGHVIFDSLLDLAMENPDSLVDSQGSGCCLAPDFCFAVSQEVQSKLPAPKYHARTPYDSDIQSDGERRLGCISISTGPSPEKRFQLNRSMQHPITS
jgi:hypothetical protein